MLCHIIRVSDEVLFRNGGTVAVPAVPAHRRIDSKQVLVHNYPSFINHVNLKLYDQIRLVCLDKLDYSTIIKSIKMTLKKQKIFFCDKIYKILLDMFDKVSLEGTDRHGSISF